MASQIGEIANTIGWRSGTPNAKRAEPSAVRTLPVVDNTNRFSSNVRTSVDCYVSGEYVQRNGKSFTVTQRYTIYVGYTKDTQAATMSQVRDRIASDFQAKYGRTFTITDVSVPSMPVPKDAVVPGVGAGQDIPMELYMGSQFFKQMHGFQRMRYEIGTERTKADMNIKSIRSRYGYRR